MAITKQPAKPTTPEAFINSAPDTAPRRVRKGHKVQITLTITEPLLDRVDELAAKLGQSRAALINLAIYQSLENGLRIEGSEAG